MSSRSKSVDTLQPDESDEGPFTPNGAADKRIALVGKFGGMNRREAATVLRSYQAIVVPQDSNSIDWIVIGAEESPLAEAELLSQSMLDSAAAGELEILHETELWQRIGLVDLEQSIRRYYTPAMLAHLLGVSVRVIRRWQRRGLITPVRTLHKLPYFDFQEVATARRLAQWIASGASEKAIEHRLVDLLRASPDLQRPLDQLPILVEGKHVLLRQGDGLIEPGGQLRIDFDALESPVAEPAQVATVLSIASHDPFDFPSASVPPSQADDLLSAVFAAEEANELGTAVDHCHAVLARDGPRAEICFLMAELLYRNDQVIAARERYYMSIEIDPEFVEARAGLASILAETGQPELAVAAYRGALDLHPDYPDAHYNLARILDDLSREVEAVHHWRRFLSLSPESPWAAEAEERLHLGLCKDSD